MDLEIVMLSEVRQRRNIIWHPLYAKSEKKWYKWNYLQNRNRLIDLENKLLVASGKDGGQGQLRRWDGRVHMAVFKMDNHQGPTILHRELCSVSRSSLAGRGVRARMDTCLWMTESPVPAVHLDITTLLIGYTPIQNKKCVLKIQIFSLVAKDPDR